MFSLSLASVEVNEFSEVGEEIVASLNGLLSRFSSGECGSVSQAEGLVLAVVKLCREKLLEVYLRQSGGQRVSGGVVCPVCESVSDAYRKRGRRFRTLCGDIRVQRWVYKCALGHFHVPWDRREGFKAGFTPGVAETMCRLAAQLNYRAAAAELKHHGIDVSHTTLHQKVREWAVDERSSAYLDEQDLEATSHWYVSADGVQTPGRAGWKGVKTGAVYRTYPQYERPSPPGIRGQSLRYVACQEPAEDFGGEWAALATQTGIYKHETDAEAVVVIGDGAAWIWNLADEHFPGAVEIVDYMHAKSHLYDVAKCVFGDEAPQEVETWVKETETSLYAGDTVAVGERLRGLAAPESPYAKEIQREIGYFQKHAARMQYETFVSNGYHIGSGIIESACKHVVGERCKQAGMRWSQDGINAILFWRCLLKNKAWDTYWKQHTPHT